MIISYNGIILGNNGSIMNYTEPPSIYDPNAEQFFTAANITNTTEKTAVNQLVLDFKSYGIWTKMLGIYPRVGLSESSQKVNLKSPGTFDSIYTGSWVYSNSGSVPDGSSTYITPGISLPDHLQKDNCSFGVYLNSPYTGSGVKTNFGFAEDSSIVNATIMACIGVSFKSTQIESYLNSSNISIGGLNSVTQQGFWANSRTSLNSYALIQPNGTITSNSITIPAPTAISLPITFAARGYANTVPGMLPGDPRPGRPVFFDVQCHAFDYVSIGLTNTELTNLRTAVINFQTTLGRQV